MCGLAGFIERTASRPSTELARCVSNMGESLRHRGPDDAGLWTDSGSGVALAHRRLSVVELSHAGHQPMESRCGRYVIAFNGEIYNHLGLRERLGVTDWRGLSDTETLLATIAAWGVEEALRQAVGMFAFALWDKQLRCLWLARDRMGEKPLYYGFQRGTLLFGSELKALRAHPDFRGDIDRNALTSYLRRGYVPSPLSIYQGIRKLPPGCYLQVPTGERQAAEPEPVMYWSLRDIASNATGGRRFDGTPEEAVDGLRSRLGDAVARQCIADVPLGAFLSGGIDSSLIVALMQAQSPRPVKTFSIGFDDPAMDEAPHAKAVARHLGTDHAEMYVGALELRAVIEHLPAMFDEPFGDSSAIPTCLVARMARQHVTVALSGDGGDELFGGYSRYRRAQDRWSRISRVPGCVRRPLARSALALPALSRRRMALASAASAEDDIAYYDAATSQWPLAQRLVIQNTVAGRAASASREQPDTMLERMMLIDSLGYLPDDVLAKVDRTAMWSSLETRVPLLDHLVVEFAWSLPPDIKVRAGETKWPLRQFLGEFVPRALTDRPKMGFGVPLDDWLRGPLRPWAEELLDERRLIEQGFLDPGVILGAWRDHLSGRANLRDPLWSVLMFQAWLSSASGPSTP